MPTDLHEARIRAVMDTLHEESIRSVLDLGCGCGEFMARLVSQPPLERLTGVDISAPSLQAAKDRLAGKPGLGSGRVALLELSFTAMDKRLQGHDAAVMLETIEHLDPSRLSVLERSVFAFMRPRLVLITTPNVEYNVLYGMRQGRFRHPEHCFEWGRFKFRSWATGVARRNGYALAVTGIGPRDPVFGCPTQMARFTLVATEALAPGALQNGTQVP